MDLDKDGILDLLSGTYVADPKRDAKRAPVHFFKGKKGGITYDDAEPVRTLSGEKPNLENLTHAKYPSGRLIFHKVIPYKTVPQFVDLNGDGNLDLVYGESSGHLIKHDGTLNKGINHFANKAEMLKDEHRSYITAGHIISPHFVDWDGDGDLDLLFGQYYGEIYYSENIGNTKEPQWKAFVEWLPKARNNSDVIDLKYKMRGKS